MKVVYKIINWYTRHLAFPHKGLKFFLKFLTKFNLVKKTYQKKLHNGLIIEVTPADHLQQQLFWYGYYEKDAILLWERLIKSESVVIDIGANIGYYSLVAAKKATQGKIIAFEPVHFLRKKITENLLINNLSNVLVQPFAIGDLNTKCYIYISGEDNAGMSGLKPQENFSGIIEETDMISLDEWLDMHPLYSADFIKIDTEGAELKVLQGMKKTLQKSCPIIFIEVMSKLLSLFQNTPADIYIFLNKLNYTAYEIVNKNTLRPSDHAREDYTLLFLPKDYKLPSDITILPVKSI